MILFVFDIFLVCIVESGLFEEFVVENGFVYGWVIIDVVGIVVNVNVDLELEDYEDDVDFDVLVVVVLCVLLVSELWWCMIIDEIVDDIEDVVDDEFVVE